MLFVNSSRPKTSVLMFQRFRFSNTVVGISWNTLDQLINARKHFLVGLLPKKVILPRFVDKKKLHSSIRSFEKESPDLNLEIAELSRSIFFFEEVSWAVACKELYSSKEITTTPESLPLLIISGSKFWVTLFKYFLRSFLNFEILAVIIWTILYEMIQYKRCVLKESKTKFIPAHKVLWAIRFELNQHGARNHVRLFHLFLFRPFYSFLASCELYLYFH